MDYSTPGGAWQPPPPPYHDDPNAGYAGGYTANPVGFGTPGSGNARRRRWPFVVAGAVLLGLGLIAAFVFFIIGLVRPAYDVAHAYLAGLAAHDYQTAAALACDGSAEGAQRAGEFLEQAGAIGGFNLTSAELSTGFGEVGGSITLGGQDFGIDLDVGHGDDGWKVCDFWVASLGTPRA